jgi:hypothetical protein
MLPKVAWHAIIPVQTKGRFNPNCREDVVSREIWTKNVTEKDKALHRAYQIKQMRRLYPELNMEKIEYYLNR